MVKTFTIRITTIISLAILLATGVSLSKHRGQHATPLPNFSAYQNFVLRKDRFIAFLVPIATRINAQILTNRQRLMKILSQSKPETAAQRAWLKQLAKRYKVKPWNPLSNKDNAELYNRVDIVPTSMIIAQAANESAWGTSRFARQGNNLFGQWCYVKGCGLVPKRRNPGAVHEVKFFPSPTASVKGYINNLNTNRHYQYFRQLRADERANYSNLNGISLAEGLGRYSQIGERYITIIQSIITNNNLAQYDKPLHYTSVNKKYVSNL